MSAVASVQVQSYLSVTETLDNAPEAGDSTTVTMNEWNQGQKNLTSSTTPPVTKHCAEEVDPSGSGASTATIDLTDFTDLEGESQDASGLKVQVLRVRTPSTNTGNVTIGPAGANPYQLFGTGTSVEFPPDSELNFQWNDTLADVSATVKNVLISASGSDTAYVQLVLG